ncbi:hypothetical protein HAX54_048268 [Datura stramonium]|uniref:Uncharacterized protein n=1 Tax=Datura stramonium TaxID=4076 RepID=A0ABS8WL62_DATST|nr:hypothetical protein [Datura stramonium]
MASSELRNLKKQKEKAVDDDDRISQLSDTLMVQILSLLLAEDVVTSCVLSKSWEEDDIEEDSCHDHHQDIRNLILDYLQELSHETELIIGTWFAKVYILQFFAKDQMEYKIS